MQTITKEQLAALRKIAKGIIQSIQEHNDAHDIMHPLIWAGVSGDDEIAYFEIKHFRAHSAQEESDLYSAINNIGYALRAAGFSEDLRGSGDNSFVTSYTIVNQ